MNLTKCMLVIKNNTYYTQQRHYLSKAWGGQGTAEGGCFAVHHTAQNTVLIICTPHPADNHHSSYDCCLLEDRKRQTREHIQRAYINILFSVHVVAEPGQTWVSPPPILRWRPPRTFVLMSSRLYPFPHTPFLPFLSNKSIQLLTTRSGELLMCHRCYKHSLENLKKTLKHV